MNVMDDINTIIKEGTIYNYDEAEKFKIIKSQNINLSVINYLKQRFINLDINIFDKYKGNLFDLMEKGKLEGWCWQTTETSIVFLNDDDYIARGNLILDDEMPLKKYYHSWICFKYNNEDYVLDACLNILCKKEIYDEIFKTEIKTTISAQQVRNELINRILGKICGDELLEQSKEIAIYGNDDVTSPMYRNSAGYKAEMENEKIKKLSAYYYFSC